MTRAVVAFAFKPGCSAGPVRHREGVEPGVQRLVGRTRDRVSEMHSDRGSRVCRSEKLLPQLGLAGGLVRYAGAWVGVRQFA